MTCDAQGSLAIKKSTLTSVGSHSTAFSSTGNNYYIAQSIGQSGITQAVKTRTHNIQQGFLQNQISISINTKQDQFNKVINVKVYPNPFTEYINIAFVTVPEQDIEISLFSIHNQLLYHKVHAPESKITIAVKHLFLQEGTYILKVNKESKKLIHSAP